MPTNGNSFIKDEVTGYLEPTHKTGTIPFGVESKKRFIKLMEDEGDLAKVCDIVGVSLKTYYTHCELDQAFARDIAITLRRMASHIEGTMYKRALEKNGVMDRFGWLRRWFPNEWNPKTSVSIISDTTTMDQLFASLEAQGKLINVDSGSSLPTEGTDKPS